MLLTFFHLKLQCSDISAMFCIKLEVIKWLCCFHLKLLWHYLFIGCSVNHSTTCGSFRPCRFLLLCFIFSMILRHIFFNLLQCKGEFFGLISMWRHIFWTYCNVKTYFWTYCNVRVYFFELIAMWGGVFDEADVLKSFHCSALSTFFLTKRFLSLFIISA